MHTLSGVLIVVVQSLICYNDVINKCGHAKQVRHCEDPNNFIVNIASLQVNDQSFSDNIELISLSRIITTKLCSKLS